MLARLRVDSFALIDHVDIEKVGGVETQFALVGVAHFQTADIVLQQQRQQTPVRMRARAQLVGGSIFWHRRIFQDAAVM